MADQLSKRVSKNTFKLGPDYDNSSGGEDEPKRVTRRGSVKAVAVAVNPKPRGKPKGNKSNKVNNDARRTRGGDQVDDDEWHDAYDAQEIDDMNGKIA